MMEKYAVYIKNNLSRREILEQLAEECAEMCKASLKMIRAEGLSSNPTPITGVKAREDFIEELYDVLSVVYVLGIEAVWPMVSDYWKWKRWAERLGYKEAAAWKSCTLSR